MKAKDIEKIEAGYSFKNRLGETIVIAKVHEWEKYYDLECYKKGTSNIGGIRVFK